MRLNPTPVEPIGERDTQGFAHYSDGCRWVNVRVPVFPPSPDGDALRDVRRLIGLGEAARHVNLTPEQMSGLERGRYTLTNPEWNWLLGEMGRLAASKAAP